jgi:hypothetical protein
MNYFRRLKVMKTYRVKLYPNNESDVYEVEAENVEEAIDIAEELVRQNSFFIATIDDVEEVEL